MSAKLLEASGLVKIYRGPRHTLFGKPDEKRAVDGVDFVVQAGRSLGIVGESGSGKSTLARLALALERPTAGEVRFEGRALFDLSARELRRARENVSIVFQDPFGSLDPRRRIGATVGEPLAALGGASRGERRERARDALADVGLGSEALEKYPHEFSGGQRQRIAIARALITRPKLVVADEPVSALDVSVQAQVLNLLETLRVRAGLTYLLISHDLAVIGHVCDEVAVMFAGRFVETGPTAVILAAPAHPYTADLIAASPQIGRTRASRPPAVGAASVQNGCAYAGRCGFAQAKCSEAPPTLIDLGDGRSTACHFPRTR